MCLLCRLVAEIPMKGQVFIFAVMISMDSLKVDLVVFLSPFRDLKPVANVGSCNSVENL